MSGKVYLDSKVMDHMIQRHLSVKTVDSHREHIKRKLGFEDSHQLVQAAVTWTLAEQGNPEMPLE